MCRNKYADNLIDEAKIKEKNAKNIFDQSDANSCLVSAKLQKWTFLNNFEAEWDKWNTVTCHHFSHPIQIHELPPEKCEYSLEHVLESQKEGN